MSQITPETRHLELLAQRVGERFGYSVLLPPALLYVYLTETMLLDLALQRAHVNKTKLLNATEELLRSGSPSLSRESRFFHKIHTLTEKVADHLGEDSAIESDLVWALLWVSVPSIDQLLVEQGVKARGLARSFERTGTITEEWVMEVLSQITPHFGDTHTEASANLYKWAAYESKQCGRRDLSPLALFLAIVRHTALLSEVLTDSGIDSEEFLGQIQTILRMDNDSYRKERGAMDDIANFEQQLIHSRGAKEAGILEAFAALQMLAPPSVSEVLAQYGLSLIDIVPNAELGGN